MKEAFSYMFKDNCFWKKAGGFFSVLFISGLLTSYEKMNLKGCPFAKSPQVNQTCDLTELGVHLLGFLIYLIVIGYFISSISAISKQNKNYVLPFINIGQNFLKGLKFIFAFSLVVVTLSIICFLLYILACNFGPFFKVVAVIIPAVLAILFLLFYLGIFWNFANTDKFFSVIDFKGIWNLIKTDKSNYLISLGLYWLITAIGGALAFVIALPILYFFVTNDLVFWIATALISSLVGTYANFISIFLFAKSIKIENS